MTGSGFIPAFRGPTDDRTLPDLYRGGILRSARI